MNDQNHGLGGVYYKSAPGTDRVRVCGTDKPLSEQEQKALAAAQRRSRAEYPEAETSAEEATAVPAKSGDRSK